MVWGIFKTESNVTQYVQYGCGLSAPEGWLNFDASPTLRLQRIFLLGILFRKISSVKFPLNVRYGNVIKGLPNIKSNSCRGVYCSHVLEHLSLQDMRLALKHTYDILEPNGLFRLVLPDLSVYAKKYLSDLDNHNHEASIKFMRMSLLGIEQRKTGFRAVVEFILSNKSHLWMWDPLSMTHELHQVGFTEVRPCKFNDSEDPMFRVVESKGRFNEAIALEARK